MKLAFEYGHGLMEANLPDTTDVFIPGETVKDPPDRLLERGEGVGNPVKQR